MTTEELTKQLAEFIGTAYKTDASAITAETTFDSLNGTSMNMIALTSEIENELDAEVTIHEIMKMKTVGELVERVEQEL